MHDIYSKYIHSFYFFLPNSFIRLHIAAVMCVTSAMSKNLIVSKKTQKWGREDNENIQKINSLFLPFLLSANIIIVAILGNVKQFMCCVLLHRMCVVFASTDQVSGGEDSSIIISSYLTGKSVSIKLSFMSFSRSSRTFSTFHHPCISSRICNLLYHYARI